MKKITTKTLLVFALLFSAFANAQCLETENGQWPFETISAAACDGIASTLATGEGYASEYSLVEVVAGETYTFKSSVATDYITISSDDGVSAVTYGATPLTWVSDVSGVVRFYTHADDLCGGDGFNIRTRSFVCGIPPCIVPTVAFSKTYDCGSSTFQVDVDITDVGDAASITVTDDQGSASQSVSSANLVTFGPYPFGTSVVLTATNDQTPVCNVVSDTQIVYACPPLNDECADAIALNCGDVLTNQTTDGATGGTSNSCAGTIGDDIWYTFAGDGQVVTLTATASVEFPQIEVYASTDGTCSGIAAGNCIAVDGFGDSIASVTLVSVIGTTYYMHIGSWINGDPAIVFDLSMTCAAPALPPANDECDGAYAVTVNTDASCSSVTAGDLSGATGSTVTDTDCFGTPDDDVWFSFVATETAHLISLNDLGGSTTDLYHSLWIGDCSNLTLKADSCSDNETSVQTGLVAGTTYYIRVYSYTNVPLQTSTFNLCVGMLPTPPANDECDGAYAVTVNADASCASVTAGDLTGSTGSTVNDTECSGTADDDVWFSFVATDTRHSISLNDLAGSTTDLYHSIWSGDCTGLTLLPNSCSDNNSSEVSGLTIDATYYIRVYSWTSSPLQTSTFNVCVGTLPPPPANDDCIGAIDLTVGSTFENSAVLGSNLSASTVAGLTYGCQSNRNNDVWYSAIVPDSGNLTVETAAAPTSGMTDSVISVFTGNCGELNEIGCNDDSDVDTFSKVELTGLTPGITIYIGVWKWGSSSDGDFQISAYDETLSNDVFENSNFKAYPNPVKDILNLSYSKNISNVAVYNLLGQEVMTKSASDNQSKVDMSNIASGTYLVKVTADNQIKTIKVIKE